MKKLSSDLCAGVSLVGGITAAVFGLMSMLLAISKNDMARPLLLFFAFPGFMVSLVVFVVFYRESTRMRHLEAEEELIRKLAIEKLEKDKLK